uniref:Ankyrin repeat and SOCS box containing 2 n=1 Tax=Sinocyclocheilus grahami TaxID=75366 RepID=A0A672PB76_SINGR
MNVLIVSGSIMAAARVSMPGATDSNLEFADYSLYSNLSDDELMQLAIERSIADAQNSEPGPRRAPPSHHPQQQTEPAACPANPPRYSLMGFIQTEMRCRHKSNSHCDFFFRELEPIVKAISEGDVGSVRLLVKQPGCNLLKPNKDGWIPLHEAAYYGQDQCIKIILRAQPGMINQRTLKEQTALMIAVTREHLACVERLLEKGADPDIANKEKETPLYKACEKENPAMVAMLLNYGASVNKNCIQGWTALHESVCRNNVEICEMLIKAGAKVSMPNMYGITPIFVAAQSGKVDALRMLLKNGADLNSQAADGATALYEACKNGHENIVEFLLSQNADANKPGKTGLLPIHIAAQRGNDSIISMLIPATSKARVRRTGISPLHLAAERNRNYIVEFLIEAEFDVNAMLSEDRSMMYEDRRSTALYFAVMNNNIDATTMLLKAGANPNLDTFNPLLVALRQGCIQTVTLLVEHGANVNAYIPTHPTTFPASVMFCMKYLTILKYLMDNGCDALSCFNCVYGSNLHPPIKTRQKACVQVRESIINSTYNVIFFSEFEYVLPYLLLKLFIYANYFSHLCIHLLVLIAVPPRPLMQLCRLKIRNLLGIKRLKKINRLPVPPRLIKFLNHQEREQDF